MKVELTRDEIEEILVALSDARDPFGERAGELEDRLRNLLSWAETVSCDSPSERGER